MKNQKELLLELLELTLIIQEKGIASVSFEYISHIPFIAVKLYSENDSSNPSYKLNFFADDIEKQSSVFTECIETLKAVIEHGMVAIPGIEERNAEILKKKKALYLELKEQLKELEAA